MSSHADIVKPSKSGDMLGSSATSNSVVETYDEYALEIQGILCGMARAVAPELASKYREVYRKTVPQKSISPHGLFTGHVVTWNMVVHQHRDKGDAKLCAILCHGMFDGGALFFPQFGQYAAHG